MNVFGSSSTTLGTNGFEVSLNYISGVPDPNILTCSPKVKLAFKALLKRDETTKEKSLSELLQIIDEDSTEIDDDLVVLTWVQLYPKLSLDISKRVRILSHQVQSRFVKVLGKKYAKFLKDTIGVWLAGSFESDRLAAKECAISIQEAFGRNQGKTDALWKIFPVQILEFCFQVFKFESRETLSDERFIGKDEAEAKYQRVLFSSISILSTFVTKQDSSMSEELAEKLGDILLLESLWNCAESKDLQLKKATYVFGSLLVTKQPTLVTPDIYKVLCKHVIKGLKLKSVPQPIVYSPVIVPMLECLITLTAFNAKVWDQKNSKTRLFDLISLGSCNSHSSYFRLVLSLLKSRTLPESIVNFSSADDVNKLISAFGQNVDKERQVQFAEGAWNLYLETVAFSLQTLPEDESTLVSQNFSKTVESKLGTKLPLPVLNILAKKDCFQRFIQALHKSITTSLPCGPVQFSSGVSYTDYSILVDNVYQLFKSSNDKLVFSLFEAAFESVGSQSEETGSPVFALHVIDKSITVGFEQGETLTSFIEELPMFLEDSFVALPLKLLIHYSQSKLLKKETLYRSINDCYIKATMIENSQNNLQLLMDNLAGFKGFDITQCEDLNNYIEEQSADVTAEGSSLGFKLATREIIYNLYVKAKHLGKLPEFAQECALNFQPAVEEFLASNSEMFSYIWSSLDNTNSQKILDLVEQKSEDSNVVKAYFQGLLVYLTSDRNTFVDSPEIATRLSALLERQPALLENILVGTDAQSLGSALGSSPDLRLFISNSFEANILLPHQGEIHLGDPKLAFQFCAKMKLVSDLVGIDLSNQVKILIGVAAEAVADLVFMETESKSQELQPEATALQLKADKIIQDSISNNALNQNIVDILQGAAVGEDGSIFSELFDLVNSEKYTFNARLGFARVLKRALGKLVENTSVISFESLDFNWAKLLKMPLVISAFVSSSPKFLTSAKLERARNQVASELIGLRGNEILVKGLTNLTLLIDFISFDFVSEVSPSFTVAPLNRWVMVLNNLNNWLDSDLAYEPEFLTLRLQLLNFCCVYLNRASSLASSQESLPKFLEFAMRLGLDSLGIAAVGDGLYNKTVTYYSLKLYLALDRLAPVNPYWEEQVPSFCEEILEIVKQFTAEKQTKDQSYFSVEDLIARIIDSGVLTGLLEEETLYTLLNSESLELQSVAAKSLSKLFLSRQDALVVEYELSRTSLSEGSEVVETLKLPEELLKNVGAIWDADMDETEELKRASTYLWSWCLIFTHFSNVSAGIRQEYTKQLTENDALARFFGTVFYWLQTNGGSALDVSSLGELSSFNEITDLEGEERLYSLAFVAYYMALKFTGSFAQSWFNDLRDRNMKSEIEKFTTTHVSPKLIEEQLASVEGQVDRLKEIENFSIRINRVTKEVKCFHHIDEQLMEVVIAIPASYPLANVSVTGPLRIGVKETQWKAWLLASQYVISVQNGSIVEAIELFNKNVSLHFSGFEECAICYSILHIDHSLPTKSCTTCNNKFHSGCLYKWFKSSGSSTCPLCRSAFSFRVGQS
ncbi:unnamed protein product [Kuraishia capsulata CBS 1993]|uniref:E3 ubiquitin-protein ligase listerin n=1 Tax=Kuraishia capsulata CBS 1993 TaxID=1382522 RepID=W6MX82_9ASCO|nr:uncharacterized protein KUCA_T00004417001 [Kuraishia capsulata CBS 1993]CDK28435.1 unnamed protein product [Kuraishia capsulata CBS 1993]